jgi:hypothetical protein
MSDTFGFSAATTSNKSTKEKIAEIKPSEPESGDVPLERIDKIAEARGFTSRETRQGSAKDRSAVEASRKRRREVGPRVAVNMMMPEPIATPFIDFCEQNRYSYWEGVQELMRRAKLL